MPPLEGAAVAERGNVFIWEADCCEADWPVAARFVWEDDRLGAATAVPDEGESSCVCEGLMPPLPYEFPSPSRDVPSPPIGSRSRREKRRSGILTLSSVGSAGAAPAPCIGIGGFSSIDDWTGPPWPAETDLRRFARKDFIVNRAW